MKMRRKEIILLFFSSMMSVIVLASNLMATKIWDFGGFPVDGGYLLFPVSYVLNDVTVEIYGRKTTNFISGISTICSGFAIAMLALVNFLPAHPSYGGQAHYAYIFGFAARVTSASLISLLASQLTNNYFFVRIKNRQIKTEDLIDVNGVISHGYKIRAIGSSVIALVVDLVIFETIAYIGVLPMVDFFQQIVIAFVLGFLAELLITLTISQPVVVFLKKFIEFDYYDNYEFYTEKT